MGIKEEFDAVVVAMNKIQEKEQKKSNDWISITERYPKPLDDVLVVRKNGTQCVAYWSDQTLGWTNFPGDCNEWKVLVENCDVDCKECNDWNEINLTLNDVIWWRHLPELPKIENEGKDG